MAKTFVERFRAEVDNFRVKMRLRKLAKKYSQNEQKIYYEGVRDCEKEIRRQERRRASTQNRNKNN